MISAKKKQQLEDVMFCGWFVRLKVDNDDDRSWLDANGTFFPHENGWFIEGWGQYYSNEPREESGRILEVQEMQVPSLGGLAADELSYIAKYNGVPNE